MPPGLSYAGVFAVVLATAALGYVAGRRPAEGLSQAPTPRILPAHFEETVALAVAALALALAAIWAGGVGGRRPLIEGVASLLVGALGVAYALVIARRRRRRR